MTRSVLLALLLAAGALYVLPARSQSAPTVMCALGSNASAYNAYVDQRPSGDAMELAGKVNGVLGPACRPNCPTLAMFRNTTAPHVMLMSTGGQIKLVYNPEFFTTVYENYGD